MPRPSKRTRSRKPVSKSLPGSGNTVHYKEKGNTAQLCFVCGQQLGGVKQAIPSQTSKINRTRRRVWRPYGGQLCHNCLKNGLRIAARHV